MSQRSRPSQPARWVPPTHLFVGAGPQVVPRFPARPNKLGRGAPPETLHPRFRCDGRTYVDQPCPLCGDGRRRVLLSQPVGDFVCLHVVECRACGMLYSAPRITSAHRLDLYARWAAQRHGHAHFDLGHQLGTRDLYVRGMSWLLPRLPGNRVMDFGCGGGLCLTMWRRAAPALDLYASSFDPAEVREALATLGCTGYVLADLADRDSLGLAAVTLFNVLEHVLTPQPTLATLVRHLAPEGLLLVVVPNCWPMQQRLRLRRPCPPDLSLYEHVNHFTPESLRRCLSLAGLRVVTWLDDVPRGVEPASRPVSGRQRLRDGLARCVNRWTGSPALFANMWCVAAKASGSQAPDRGRRPWETGSCAA